MKPHYLLTIFALIVPVTALASNTVVLPPGMLMLDGSMAHSVTDVRWDDNRQAQPLIRGIDRYEPGGGLQGTITAKPHVVYNIAVTQLQLGVLENLTLAAALPVVTSSSINPNLGWIPGVYQPQMGRKYSEADFWGWAKSMGQNKPGNFSGNNGVLADMVLGARYRLPQVGLLRSLGLDAAITAQFALPTGRDPDPEQLVAGGTRVWDLHDYGDAELHLAIEKAFTFDGVPRLRLGVDVYHSILRERTFQTPTGAQSPLLLTFAPYVGGTYRLDPGDLDGITGLIEVVPLVGPTWPVWIAGHDIKQAAKFPPLLQLWFAHTYVHVAQSYWHSNSALWDWQHDRDWLPGDKNTVKLGGEFSMMRLGIPMSLYASYRAQDWIPGRNTRASDVLMVGARLIVKVW